MEKGKHHDDSMPGGNRQSRMEIHTPGPGKTNEKSSAFVGASPHQDVPSLTTHTEGHSRIPGKLSAAGKAKEGFSSGSPFQMHEPQPFPEGEAFPTRQAIFLYDPQNLSRPLTGNAAPESRDQSHFLREQGVLQDAAATFGMQTVQSYLASCLTLLQKTSKIPMLHVYRPAQAAEITLNHLLYGIPHDTSSNPQASYKHQMQTAVFLSSLLHGENDSSREHMRWRSEQSPLSTGDTRVYEPELSRLQRIARRAKAREAVRMIREKDPELFSGLPFFAESIDGLKEKYSAPVPLSDYAPLRSDQHVQSHAIELENLLAGEIDRIRNNDGTVWERIRTCIGRAVGTVDTRRAYHESRISRHEEAPEQKALEELRDDDPGSRATKLVYILDRYIRTTAEATWNNFSQAKKQETGVTMDDFTQEARILAWQLASSMPMSSIGYIRSYIAGAIQKHLLDLIKSETSLLSLPFDRNIDGILLGYEPAFADHIDEKVLLSRVMAVLPALTEQQQIVVQLRFLQEYTLEETAQFMGKEVTQVKALQHRALASINRLLATDMGDHT